MHYHTLPNNQEKISSIGLGTWVFGGENWGGADDESCVQAVQTAIAAGVNIIDTAPFYSDGLSERLVGRAIKGQRDKVFIATKCGLVRKARIPMIDLSPATIQQEIELSLSRLQCDVIDLYQPHWPDKITPIGKTMETLLKLQSQKKIRHIGICNCDITLLQSAMKYAPIKTLQMQYSLLDRDIEKDLVPFCLEQGIGIIAYGPMGGGILTGKYKEPPQVGKFDARSAFYKFFKNPRFNQIKQGVEELKKIGWPVNQIALNWVRQQPGVLTVLAGCRMPSQVTANMAAADWELSASEIISINSIRF